MNDVWNVFIYERLLSKYIISDFCGTGNQVTYKTNPYMHSGVTVSFIEYCGEVVYLTKDEWTAFVEISDLLMKFWDSLYLEPFIPPVPEPVLMPYYTWSYVDDFGAEEIKSDVMFFTYNDAERDAKETDGGSFELKIEEQFRPFNFKQMIIAAYQCLLRKEIIEFAKVKCTGCANNLPQQNQHFGGCLMDFQTAVDTYYDNCRTDDFAVSKLMYKVRNVLKIPVSQYKILNFVRCFDRFFSKDVLLDMVKADLPKRYDMLFSSIGIE